MKTYEKLAPNTQPIREGEPYDPFRPLECTEVSEMVSDQELVHMTDVLNAAHTEFCQTFAKLYPKVDPEYERMREVIKKTRNVIGAIRNLREALHVTHTYGGK